MDKEKFSCHDVRFVEINLKLNTFYRKLVLTLLAWLSGQSEKERKNQIKPTKHEKRSLTTMTGHYAQKLHRKLLTLIYAIEIVIVFVLVVIALAGQRLTQDTIKAWDHHLNSDLVNSTYIYSASIATTLNREILKIIELI